MVGERVEELDRYKGLLIFLVVLGHFLLPIKDSGMALFSRSFYGIYSFHMSAFIFLSGYFFQQSFVKRGRKVSSLFSTLLYDLLCYFLLKTLLHPVDMFCYGEKAFLPDYLHESSTPWYLLGIFFWQVACLPLVLLHGKRMGIKSQENDNQVKFKGQRAEVLYLLFLILLSLMAGNLDAGGKIQDFLALDRVFGFAPFFYLGMLLSFSSVSSSIWKKKNNGFALLGGGFLFALLFFFPEGKGYTRIFYGTWYQRVSKEAILPVFQNYPIFLRLLYIPFALCIAYFVFCLLSFWILPFAEGHIDRENIFLHRDKPSDKLSVGGSGFMRKPGESSPLRKAIDKYLSRWGKYSLVIYLFHRPFRDIFLKIGGYQYFLYTKKGGLEQASFFLLLLLISTILSFLLGRKSLYQICKKRW